MKKAIRLCRHYALLACTLWLTAGGTTGQVRAQAPVISVGAWDGGATIKGGILTYQWLTLKRSPEHGPPIMSQSLASYDRHITRATLGTSQWAWVRRWEQRYRVFSLARRYPSPPGKETYAAAFGGNLSVQDGGQSVSSRWSGMSRASRANVAANSFLVWARRNTGSQRWKEG